MFPSKKRANRFFLSVFLLSIGTASYATEDAYLFPIDGRPNLQNPIVLPKTRLQKKFKSTFSTEFESASTGNPQSPNEIYSRTEFVLNAFSVPPEKPTFEILKTISIDSTRELFFKWLPYFDAENQFARFFDLNDLIFSGFKDRDAKRIQDFKKTLLKEEEKTVPKRLDGMRIALDPGHMGEDFWDKETGKFVRDEHGNTLSEGILNLQVCLLLKTAFEELGATVMITHSAPGPVTEKQPQDIDLETFGKNELRMRSLESWFLDLLQSTTLDNLVNAFSRDSRVQNLFSEKKRMNYFVLREDLSARANKINSFKPDLTLIIHFDAGMNTVNPRGGNFTRTYVPGAFGTTEYPGTRTKAEFAAHMLQLKKFEEGVELSSKIVNSISSRLNVPLLKKDMDGTVPVVPGVFARNLAVNRMVTSGVSSYLECLVYNNEEEFYRLSQKDFVMQINGKDYPVSQRLVDLAVAIRDAVWVQYH